MVLAPLPDKPLFTIPEAVHWLGVSRATVYNWIDCGRLVVVGPFYLRKVTRESLVKELSKLSTQFYDD